MVPYLFLADVALLVTLALSALLYNAGSSPNKSLPHYYRWIRHRHVLYVLTIALTQQVITVF